MRALSFSTVMWQTGSIAVAGFFRKMSRIPMLTSFRGRPPGRQSAAVSLAGWVTWRAGGPGGRRLAREVEQPRVRPLNGGDVGQDLAAVPAVFVAPLLERLGRQRAQPGGGLRCGGAQRLDELGLGGGALLCHEWACPRLFHTTAGKSTAHRRVGGGV